MNRRGYNSIWYFVLLLTMVSLLIGISGCERETGEEPVMHTLQVHIIGEGETGPALGDFEEMTSVEIEAKPAQGWRFFRWEGEVTDREEANTSVLMEGDVEITAIFVEENHGPGFSGWEGTEAKPFLIKTSEQLDRVRDYLDYHFVLISDLDLGIYENWDPIGEFSSDGEEIEYDAFTGSFDGRGYSIQNLTIHQPQGESIGLFSITDGATLKNMDMVHVDVEGEYYVGTLVGRFGAETGGLIQNCHVEGTVVGDFAVGGLVGVNSEGEIEESSTDCTIHVNGYWIEEGFVLAYTGGLVGLHTSGEIRNSSAIGSITGEGNLVGGLVGFSRFETSSIHDSFATGDIQIEGQGIGGFLGANEGEVKSSYAEGSVSGSSNVGGLIGFSSGEVYDSYFLGDVLGDGQGGGHFGGLIGELSGTLVDSYSTGDVRVDPLGEHSVAGGLVGWMYREGSIVRCYANGDVIGKNQVGGLVGGSEGEIDESYATGDVSGERNIGGFVGYIREGASITHSFSTGGVTGESEVGGLVGGVDDGIISYSYATGDVTGMRQVGGFVGWFQGMINDSYARGDVVSHGGYDIGGLIGEVYGELQTIENTYASGLVEGDVSGGLIGSVYDHQGDSVVSSYYDKNNTGQEDDDGRGQPKTTDEMMQEDTFEGWNFNSIWSIDEGTSYPFFQWE